LSAVCVRALDARLALPGGTPIGLPAELPAPLLQLEWCAPFAGPVRAALHDLKYAGERRLAAPLGDALARRWARVGTGAEVIVPVPVHAERTAARA
jgi:predicted amidophosphoribosyltransferase